MHHAVKNCPQSEFLYIGETERRACDRFQDHQGYVNQGKMDHSAAKHFTQKGHTTMDMKLLLLERVFPTGDTALRRTRERVWIRHYDSVTY